MSAAQVYRIGSDGLWASVGRPSLGGSSGGGGGGPWVPGVVEPTLANLGTSAATCGARIPRSSMTVNSSATFNPVDGHDYTNTVFTGHVVMNGNTGGTFTDCYFAGNAGTTNEGGAVDLIAGSGTSGKRWVFTNCTFQPDTPTAWTDNIIGHHFTLTRCLLRGGTDCVGVYNKFGPRNDVVIEGCYLGFMSWAYPDPTNVHPDGTHCDNIQCQGANGLTVQGNAIWGYVNDTTGNIATNNPSGSNNGPYPYRQAGQIIMSQINSPMTTLADLTYTDNWIYGGANGITIRDLPTNVTVKNNRWMDNGMKKDGSHLNFIRTSDGQVINTVTYHTGYTNTTATDGNRWGYAGADAFGTSHSLDAILVGGYRVP